MKIEIVGRKYKVSDKLESIIERKLSRFDKFFDDNTTATVICKEDGNKMCMELTIKLKDRTVLRSETASDNMYSNIDDLLPKIERQIRKHKTRLEKSLRAGAYDDEEEYFEDRKVEIVKRKQFSLDTISVDDAIDQLDMIQNSFYVFVNSSTDKVSAVYKRKDGSLGLIDFDY